jgi:hypothetical protein
MLKKYIQQLPVPGAGIVVATPSGLNQYSFTQTVYYPNEQTSTLLWFHDHALGATRLNRLVNKQKAKATEEDG